MITIEVYCAMCGKDREIKVDRKGTDLNKPLRSFIECNGWIGQQNGENYDIYCSERCAS